MIEVLILLDKIVFPVRACPCKWKGANGKMDHDEYAGKILVHQGGEPIVYPCKNHLHLYLTPQDWHKGYTEL